MFGRGKRTVKFFMEIDKVQWNGKDFPRVVDAVKNINAMKYTPSMKKEFQGRADQIIQKANKDAISIVKRLGDIQDIKQKKMRSSRMSSTYSLYGYFGFLRHGKDPTEDFFKLLESGVKVTSSIKKRVYKRTIFGKRKMIVMGVNVKYTHPGVRAIYDKTKLPWAPGRSWMKALVLGGDLGKDTQNYMQFKSRRENTNSRSGVGVQASGLKIMSTIVSEARENPMEYYFARLRKNVQDYKYK